MLIDATTGTSTTSQATASASAGLADNMDTFLKLLTTQMKNQDPLNPMESSEFTQQLVAFSEVEQSIATNMNLENLIGLQQATQATGIVNYLGKEIEAVGDETALQDGAAAWQYEIPANTESVVLNISDANGNVVHIGSGEIEEGTHVFNWDGTDLNGNTLADGLYTMEVIAKDSTGKQLPTSTMISGLVTGVESADGVQVLTLGDVAVPVSKVMKLQIPTPTAEN
jgi:flagellar basal-body rod modification protein FlgD